MKKRLWIIMVLLSSLLGLCWAEGDSLIGIAINSNPYNIVTAYPTPSSGAATAGSISPGERVPILGLSENGSWYCVPSRSGIAYVWKNSLDLFRDSAAFTDGINSDSVEITGVWFADEEFSASGWFVSDNPVDLILVQFFDANGGQAVYTKEKPLQKPSCFISAADVMAGVNPPLELDLVYEMRIFFSVEGNQIQAYSKRIIKTVRSQYTSLESINALCSFSEKLTADGDFGTEWVPSQENAFLKISCPAEAGSLCVSWSSQNVQYSVNCLGNDGTQLMEYKSNSRESCYRSTFLLPEQTRRIEVSVSGSGIVEANVYARDHKVPDMEPLPDKTDLLFFAAHPDDELLWFSGAIPYYINQGKTVGMTYMTCDNWIRRNESVEAMLCCGMTYKPLYLDLLDHKADSLEAEQRVWGDVALLKIVQTLRRYRPEVVVSQDIQKGEYGHFQHILTARLLLKAAELAADPAYDPASSKEYGTWAVKKVYLHRNSNGTIYMDWDVPGTGVNGLSALDTAYLAFNHYVSQHRAFSMDFGKKFGYSMFGLAYSAVGEDEGCYDFFEHIP